MHAVGAYDTCISIAKAMSGCGWDEVDRPLRLMRSLSVQNLQGDGEQIVYLCSPLEQAVLQRLHKDLLWTLPSQQLAPHLYSKGLIHHYEYEQFCAKTTITDKNQHILMSLSRRPEGVLNELLGCLDDISDIPAAKEIAKSLREKLEDVKLEFSQVGSAASLQTETQKMQANPTPNMVPNVVFEYLRDENKKLKKENESLKNESEMLRYRARLFEVKFKRFKKKVRRQTAKLKEAVESSDDEDSDNETHNLSRQTTEAIKHPQQETIRSGFNAVSDFACESSASSVSSGHVPDSYDEDRVPTPTEDPVRQTRSNQSRLNLERCYSLQNLSSQLSAPSYNGEQQVIRHNGVPPSHFVVDQEHSSDDEPDSGKQKAASPHTSYAPDPTLPTQNGESVQSSRGFQRLVDYFNRDKQSSSKSSTATSVGQLQNAKSHRNTSSTARSHTSATPQEKAERTRAKTHSGGNFQNGSSVDKPSSENVREKADLEPEKPQPPPKSAKRKTADGKASTSNGRSRSRYQLKFAQLNHPQ